MSRYIDADALHEALKAKQKWVVRCGDKHNEGYTYDQVHFAIDDAPTIEVVSAEDYRSMENTCYKLQKALYERADAPSIDIVRCKECKHASDNNVYGCMCKHFNDNDWDYHRMYADDFCSYGERREP